MSLIEYTPTPRALELDRRTLCPDYATARISEAAVWRSLRRLVGAAEARRIWRQGRCDDRG